MAISQATYTPFNSLAQVVTFPADLQFRVYYLEAPLSILGQLLGNALGGNLLNVNGFHSGIGIQSTDINRPYEFTLDYIVTNGFALSSFLPDIVVTPTGPVLQWNNQGSNTIGSFIDRNYWNKSVYIATVNSARVTEMQQWVITDWIPANPIYSLFSGIRSTQRMDVFAPIMRPSICDTFSFTLLRYLFNIDEPIGYPTVPNSTISAFVSLNATSIVPVNYDEYSQQIIAFYQALKNLMQTRIDITALTNTALNTIPLAALQPANTQRAIQSAKLRQIQQDLYTPIQVASNLYSDFLRGNVLSTQDPNDVGTVFWFGYHPSGQVGYWKIQQASIYVDYIPGSLLRNYLAWDISGKPVIDQYSRNLLPKEGTGVSFMAIMVVVIVVVLILLLLWLMYGK